MSARRGRLSLLAICLGFFVIQVDTTIVNVALPAIGAGLGGGSHELQWIVDAYVLALAACMLVAGSLADRLGARRLYLAGLVVFGLASVACAVAPGFAALVAARALQGVGAAALLPCSLALLAHEFPERDARAWALGVWGGVAGAGLAGGPVLGGLLVAAVGWRAVFAVNVPVALAGLVLIGRYVTVTPRRRGGRFDAAGILTASLALALLTAGAIEAGERGWTAPLSSALLASGLAFAVAFALAERLAAAPMVPPALFRSVRFRAAVAVGGLFNLCLYGTLFCLSLYLQRARGLSPLACGLALLPMAAAIGCGSLASGPLTIRLGPRPPMVAGMALAATGAGLLCLAGSEAPLALVLAATVLVGACGLTMPAMTGVVVGAAGLASAGIASGVLNVARQAGGALGVAVLGSLLLTGSGAIELADALPLASGGYALAAALAWKATAQLDR